VFAATLLGAYNAPQTPSRLGRGHPSSYPTPLGIFGALMTHLHHATEPYHFLKRSCAFGPIGSATSANVDQTVIALDLHDADAVLY